MNRTKRYEGFAGIFNGSAIDAITRSDGAAIARLLNFDHLGAGMSNIIMPVLFPKTLLSGLRRSSLPGISFGEKLKAATVSLMRFRRHG